MVTGLLHERWRRGWMVWKGIAGEPELVRQKGGRHGWRLSPRTVRSAMRVIRGEQHNLVRAELFWRSPGLPGVRRLIDRLQGEAEVAPHDIAGVFLDPGNLRPDTAPGLVGPPDGSRHPHEARFVMNTDLQFWKISPARLRR